MPVIQRLSSPSEQDLLDLGELLRDAVASGASVNFIRVPSVQSAREWWQAALQEAGNLLFVARAASGQIIGCVRLMPEPQENAPHRAQVGKLLVHSWAQGQGVATALMEHLEKAAAAMGCTLLILDTETGSYAEDFYRKRGWVEFGRLEGHTVNPSGEISATTYFFKNV